MSLKLIPKTQVLVHETNNFYNAFQTLEPNIFAVNVTFPANEEITDKVYTLEVFANDKATGIKIPLTIFSNNEKVEYYKPIAIKEQPDVIASGGQTVDVMIYFKMEDPYISVSSITGIPSTEIKLGAGENYEIPLSSCKTSPLNATNQIITWSITDAGSTKAVFENNVLKIYDTGTVAITAKIVNGLTETTNYNQDFNIKLQPIPIESITGIPQTFGAEESFTLNGIISPPNARNQNIKWSLVDAGITGTTINDNILNGINPGLIIVGAKIEDGLSIGNKYYQEFTMRVEHPSHISVQKISGVSPSFRIGQELDLSTVTVEPANAKSKDIKWTIASDSGTSTVIDGNKLKSPIAVGTITLRATITGGKCDGMVDSDYVQDFNISVMPKFIPVTNISRADIPIPVNVLTEILVNVAPLNATNKRGDRTFSIVDDGGTGAILTPSINYPQMNTAMLATNIGTCTIRVVVKNGISDTTDFAKDIAIRIVPFKSVTDVTLSSSIPSVVTNGCNYGALADVIPADSTIRNIIWSIAEGPAVINNLTIRITGVGNVKLRATIPQSVISADGTTYTDYIKDFDIVAVEPFHPVTDITASIPSTVTVGDTIPLSATVSPSNATHQDIIWELGYGSGMSSGTANIIDNKFTSLKPGSVFITAKILNGYEDGTTFYNSFKVEMLA